MIIFLKAVLIAAAVSIVWGIIESFQMRYGGVMMWFRLSRIIAIFLRVFPKFLIVAVLGAMIVNAVYYFDFL